MQALQGHLWAGLHDDDDDDDGADVVVAEEEALERVMAPDELDVKTPRGGATPMVESVVVGDEDPVSALLSSTWRFW